jgi:hypothetical protein
MVEQALALVEPDYGMAVANVDRYQHRDTRAGVAFDAACANLIVAVKL